MDKTGEEILNLLKELMLSASDTATQKEKQVESLILKKLREISYFKEHPDQCGYFEVEKDPLERNVVWGLVKGESKKTVVMMHHHDVVDTSVYGTLWEKAYDMDEIMARLKETQLPEEAHRDLLSGRWLFGRGSADMKAGAAIQMTCLKEYSMKKHKDINLMLISVPDEENMSAGMRSAVRLLRQLKHQENLEYTLFINSEPHEREDEKTGTIYTGSVGKIMPVIYVRGQSVHIGDIYAGISPVLIAQYIGMHIELNTEFCEQEAGQITPPPAVLYLRDRKKYYNVSTPQDAGLYFSQLMLHMSPDDLYGRLERICKDALEKGKQQYTRSRQQFEQLQQKAGKASEDALKQKQLPEGEVCSFSKLYKKAEEKWGDLFRQEYEVFMDDLNKKLRNSEINLPESTMLSIEKLISYLPEEELIVVIAFAPPYYPSVYEHNEELVLMLDKMAKEQWQENYRDAHYFMGISDMSYIGKVSCKQDAAFLKENMPGWGKLYDIPFEEIREVTMPVINIGPWGKDLHQYTERVYKEDVCEHTYKLIRKVIETIGS